MKKNIYLLLLLCLQLASGKTKIYAAGKVTLTTSSIDAANINQGSTNNIIYAVKMVVSNDAAITVDNIKFTLSGNHDANDLTTVNVYFNPNAPEISGASFLGSATATYKAPHTYSINIYRNMVAKETGYYIIAVNISTTATDDKTVRINGSTDPVVFGFSSHVTVVNNQNNGAGAQTIQAPDITLTSTNIDSANINQGSTNNIVYAVKMKVTTEPVVVNNIKFTLSGSHDANDLTTLNVYFNPTAPEISGASFLGSASAAYKAPHSYSINIYRSMAAKESGYYIIAVNVSTTATDEKTVRINGNNDPVIFSYGTKPNVTNNQNNSASAQTIQAADITLISTNVDASNINQGSTNNKVYAVKMKVTTEPVVVNNIKFTLSGNHDANDLTTVNVYFNPTAPEISGASFLGSASAAYKAPHTYSLSIYRSMAAKTSGYYIIAVNISTTATDEKTVRINGNEDPVVFSYGTKPNVTDEQKNSADALTIQAADITLISSHVDAADINQGSTNNIVYAVKMKVTTEPVVVNNIKFTLSGNHDANDLTTVNVYFNRTAPQISGASFLGSASATYKAPHTYSLSIYRSMAARESGYYIIAVNVSSTASDEKTIRLNGNEDPVVFNYGTKPNVTNEQKNSASAQTIQAADITLTTSHIDAGNIAQGSTNNIVYAVKMKVTTEPVTVNNIKFTLSGNHDANDLTTVNVYFNPTAPEISGASFLGSASATYKAPHNYSLIIYRSMAVASSGYYIIAVNVSSTGTVGHTVKINGSTDPVKFSYSTAPNITDNQTNGAGVKTIGGGFALKSGEELSESQTSTIGKNKLLTEVYPNPAHDVVNYSVASERSQSISVRLSDFSGKIFFSKDVVLNKGLNTMQINVSSLANGIYYLSLSSNANIIANKKIVVQH